MIQQTVCVTVSRCARLSVCVHHRKYVGVKIAILVKF